MMNILEWIFFFFTFMIFKMILSLLINSIIFVLIEFNSSAFDGFQIIITFLKNSLFLSDPFDLRIDFCAWECACAFQCFLRFVDSFLDVGNIVLNCVLLTANPFLSFSEILLNNFETSSLDFPFHIVGDFVELSNGVNIAGVGPQLQIFAVESFEIIDALVELLSEQFDFFCILFTFLLISLFCLPSFLLPCCFGCGRFGLILRFDDWLLNSISLLIRCMRRLILNLTSFWSLLDFLSSHFLVHWLIWKIKNYSTAQSNFKSKK